MILMMKIMVCEDLMATGEGLLGCGAYGDEMLQLKPVAKETEGPSGARPWLMPEQIVK